MLYPTEKLKIFWPGQRNRNKDNSDNDNNNNNKKATASSMRLEDNFYTNTDYWWLMHLVAETLQTFIIIIE